MKRSARTFKLMALLLAGPILLNHLACSSREISAAVSSGLQSTLSDLFGSFSAGLADTITGAEE